MTKKKIVSLLTRAKQEAAKYRKISRVCWFHDHARKHPEQAEEIRAFCLDWVSGGEARQILPRRSELHRFICAEMNLDVKYQSFGSWINGLVQDAQ